MPRTRKHNTQGGDVGVAERLKTARPSDPDFVPSYLSSRTVYELTSLSHVTVWRMVKRGEFPAQVSLTRHTKGCRRIGFLRHEIEDLLRTPQRWQPKLNVPGAVRGHG